MTVPTHIAGRQLDLSHPDVVWLLEHVVEVERELTNARQYLEDCRRVIGAREGEMLIDAIRRVRSSKRRHTHPDGYDE